MNCVPIKQPLLISPVFSLLLSTTSNHCSAFCPHGFACSGYYMQIESYNVIFCVCLLLVWYIFRIYPQFSISACNRTLFH